MNGAESLIKTLVGGGVNTCFMNPGTSEIHFVSALDSVPEMHSVLCLFEGVATGCADGYARVTGKPAASLLHLGPGLGNGISNLHNAKKAFTPMVNIVGKGVKRKMLTSSSMGRRGSGLKNCIPLHFIHFGGVSACGLGTKTTDPVRHQF